MRRKHQDLRVWQFAIRLVKDVYAPTSNFPHAEAYGLTNQMRRAAVSVPSNIAEGAARNSTKEFSHFRGVARGSLSELDTQLVIAREIGYAREIPALEKQIDDVFGLLNGLINSLKNSSSS